MQWRRPNDLSTGRLRREGSQAAYVTPLAHTAHFSHRGRRRENQDSVLQATTLDGALLCLLADGLGPAGGQVSAFAAHTVATLYGAHPNRDPRHLLPWAVDQVHQRASAWRQNRGPRETSGATLEAAVILPGRALLAHVGDSRSYLLRGQRLHRLTQDHSLAGALALRGGFSPEQLARHPGRHQLLRYIGSGQGPAADYIELATAPGDCLLICSDGLWGPLIEADLISRLYGGSPPRAALELARLALERGGEDNLSLIVVQIL